MFLILFTYFCEILILSFVFTIISATVNFKSYANRNNNNLRQSSYGFEFQVFSFCTSEILIVNRDFIGSCLYLPIYNEFFK